MDYIANKSDTCMERIKVVWREKKETAVGGREQVVLCDVGLGRSLGFEGFPLPSGCVIKNKKRDEGHSM